MDLFSLSVVIEIIVAITLGKNLGLLHQIGALVKDSLSILKEKPRTVDNITHATIGVIHVAFSA